MKKIILLICIIVMFCSSNAEAKAVYIGDLVTLSKPHYIMTRTQSSLKRTLKYIRIGDWDAVDKIKNQGYIVGVTSSIGGGSAYVEYIDWENRLVELRPKGEVITVWIQLDAIN